VDTSEFEQAVRELAEREAPEWSLSISIDEDADFPVRVSLSHPLSPGFQWCFLRSQVRAVDLAMMEETIRREPDFELVTRAPATTRSKLLLGIRVVADVFDWSSVEMRSVALILAEAGCLTQSEADWLAEARAG
jgi:hypothetical protein